MPLAYLHCCDNGVLIVIWHMLDKEEAGDRWPLQEPSRQDGGGLASRSCPETSLVVETDMKMS